MKEEMVSELGQTFIAIMDLIQWAIIQMFKNPIYFIGLIGLLIVQNNNLELQFGKLFKAKA